MKRIFSIVITVALSTLGLKAQMLQFGGAVISPANMSHMEAAGYSQTEHSFMSARVAGMGGAFTSLGADISSMSINPAGLGMYRSSELLISLDFDTTAATNDAFKGHTSSSCLDFNQIGAALNLHQSSGALVSFTLGFAYNKLADLDYTTRGRWDGGEITIGEFFAEQMYGFDPSVLNSSANPFRNNDIYTDEWGGVLAYQSYLIDPNMYEGKFMDNYLVPGVPLSTKINSSYGMASSGSVGEYAFSMGFNIANILYLGTTLGIQDVQQTVEYYFAERYPGNVGNNSELLKAVDYRPFISNYGSGVNFKVGAILRPVAPLRLGVAYHTGTSMSLTRNYYAEMETIFCNGDSYLASTLINNYTYSYTSPSKLLLGASVVIGKKAILSVDYDKVWYDGMRMHNSSMEEAFANDVEADLGSAENYRVGLELCPINGLYLRCGYAYYGSPLNGAAQKYADDGGLFFGSYKTHSNNYSLGGGMRFGTSSVDLVWTLSEANYTNSLMYYYSYVDANNDVLVTGPTLTNTKLRSNNIALSYSFRF